MTKPSIPPDLLAMVMGVGGNSPDQRFQWLVGVAERDWSKASDAELAALRWQIVGFAISGRRDLAPDSNAGPLWDPMAEVGPMVRRLHRRIRDGFRELRENGRFTLPRPVIDRLVWRPTLPDVVPVSSQDLEQRFWGAVVVLLLQVGDRLRICQNDRCSRFFLMVRPGQRYCGPRCSQYVRTARFRKSHREKVREWKHRGYVQRLRKQTGNPKLKIARRPRGSGKNPSKS